MPSAIGVCQTPALVPGVSRSGATIVGGAPAGLDRPAAAEFSFFLAMPTMAGAFVYEMWAARDLLSAERADGDCVSDFLRRFSPRFSSCARFCGS